MASGIPWTEQSPDARPTRNPVGAAGQAAPKAMSVSKRGQHSGLPGRSRGDSLEGPAARWHGPLPSGTRLSPAEGSVDAVHAVAEPAAPSQAWRARESAREAPCETPDTRSEGTATRAAHVAQGAPVLPWRTSHAVHGHNGRSRPVWAAFGMDHFRHISLLSARSPGIPDRGSRQIPFGDTAC